MWYVACRALLEGKCTWLKNQMRLLNLAQWYFSL